MKNYSEVQGGEVSFISRYELNLSGDNLHAVITALTDAERMYRKSGFAELANNAQRARIEIIKQLPKFI